MFKINVKLCTLSVYVCIYCCVISCNFLSVSPVITVVILSPEVEVRVH